MRQWDTKRQFNPNYRHIARLVFLGLVIAVRHPDWSYTFRELGSAVLRLTSHLMNILLAVVMLVLSPVAFPALCLLCKLAARSRRLAYLRRMRAADEDF